MITTIADAEAAIASAKNGTGYDDALWRDGLMKSAQAKLPDRPDFAKTTFETVIMSDGAMHCRQVETTFSGTPVFEFRADHADDSRWEYQAKSERVVTGPAFEVESISKAELVKLTGKRAPAGPAVAKSRAVKKEAVKKEASKSARG